MDDENKKIVVKQALNKAHHSCHQEIQQIKKLQNTIEQILIIVENKGVEEAVEAVEENEFEVDLDQKFEFLDEVFKEIET